tara:strand:+ start:313 stop:1440 length:1128 start_codon:yes stop_codon:yes gene_type:complete
MIWDFQVQYIPLGGSGLTSLTNVQSVNVTAGREALIDNFSSARATITLRYPTGYVTPFTGLLPGAEIVITAKEQGTGIYNFQPFAGWVSDVSVDYGIPYSGGVGNADFLTITCETSLAKLARTSGNDYALAPDTVPNQVAAATTESGVTVESLRLSGKTASGVTISGSWADWLNQLAFTYAGRIIDTTNVYVTNYQPAVISNTKFSDTATVTEIKYDTVSFSSWGQNYYTQVTIDPTGFSPQVVSTGSVPFRNLTINTYNGSTSEATDLANWYLGNYKTPNLGLASFTVNMNDTNSQNLKALFDASAAVASWPTGIQVALDFRGTTYNCVIEGGSISATPDSAHMTFYVSAADLNAYLVLDDAVFGQLDYNKLGF